MNVEFVDTNVLIYAHAGRLDPKQPPAMELILRLDEQGNGALSTQVLIEFYSAMNSKLHRGKYAEEAVKELSSWLIHRPSHADVLNTIQLQRRFRLSWWDALIVNSAVESGAKVLWTEDLNHEQRFGDLVVRNPFS
jgi:predicted nucleic acid-binding protein